MRAVPGAKLQENQSATIKPSDIPDLSLQPFQQRNIHFPYRTFGKSPPVTRSFRATWFSRFNWLHYDSTNYSVRCFTCCKAVKDGRAVSTGVTEQAFLVKGFTNWKDGTRCFSRHESCDFHKVCVAALASTVDVGDMLSRQAATEKQANREYLLKLLLTVEISCLNH